MEKEIMLLPKLPEALIVRRNAHGFNHFFTALQMDKYGRDCAEAVELGQINECLGLDPDAGGSEPIIDAINGLKSHIINLESAEVRRLIMLEKIAEHSDKYAEEVTRLKGEHAVLITLLNSALNVINSIDGENDEECNNLMELRNKMHYAINGAIQGML